MCFYLKKCILSVSHFIHGGKTRAYYSDSEFGEKVQRYFAEQYEYCSCGGFD